MKFMGLFIICMGQILFAEQRLSEMYTFPLTKEQPATLMLDWDKHKAIVTMGEKNTTLDNISEDFVMAWNEYGETDITFNDFNFDGYMDIAITFSVWQTGNNSCYDYYFFEPKDTLFYKAISHVCNLQISKKEHILHAHLKDGLDYEHRYYQIDERGKPFLFLRGENHVTNEDLSPVKYSSSQVKIRSERAYFYDMWEGKRLKTYLIRGDKVRVLDEESTREGVWWMKVSYEGKKKLYSNWLKLSDLAFEPMKSDTTKYDDRDF